MSKPVRHLDLSSSSSILFVLFFVLLSNLHTRYHAELYEESK